MSVKSDLQHSILKTLKFNRDGSRGTQANRQDVLLLCARELAKSIYKVRGISHLKQKHVKYLVHQWQEKGISVGTIKNRLANIRWLCDRLGKRNLVLDNEALGIGKRRYSTNINKAFHLKGVDLSKITNPYLKISVELQRVFGLRREECLKIMPFLADRGDKIYLKASWCKGGREREIPIRTEEQRYWLDAAKKLAKHSENSLIPPEKSYINHRRLYDRQIERAGLSKLHGFRHAYAQDRYKELTGWFAPAAGGRTSHDLNPIEREIDHAARLIISTELGHTREQITAIYLGR